MNGSVPNHHSSNDFESQADASKADDASISAAPFVLPTKAKIPPPTVPENRALFRVLLGNSTSATTVFVGNISELSNDNLIRQVLQSVGKMLNWRRVQGPNARLQPFGFCEYEGQEDALRALRILNGFKICDKKLIVNVDDKTRRNLDQYEQEQREYVKNKLKTTNKNETEHIANARKVEDTKAVENLRNMLKGHIIFKRPTNQEESPSLLDGVGESEVKKSKKDTKTDTFKEEKFVDISRKDRKFTEAVKGRRKGSPTVSDDESREEMYEKRRRERRQKIKEDCYQHRLKRWQSFEQNLISEIEKREAKEKRRATEKEEKFKTMLDFLAKYDDDLDDSKHYRGHVWNSKLDDRDDEIKGEERDKRREQQEKTERNNEKDQSSEYSSLESDPQIDLEIQDVNVTLPSLSDLTNDPDGEYDSEGRVLGIGTNLKDYEEENLVRSRIPNSSSDRSRFTSMYDSSKPVVGFGIKRQQPQSSGTQQDTGLEDIFAPDEEIVVQPVPKKIKLTVIDKHTKKTAPSIEFGPESAKYLTPEERKHKITKLIEKIPTDKNEIFRYDVKWFLVDQRLVDKKLKGWVKKRIVDYIGEEEPTLVKYICQKVLEKSTAESLLEDIMMILDDEAEVFVIKLWRLLIYVTEAKSRGLVQD